MIEAKKLAYADMLAHVGDPRFSTIPVTAMLDKDRAAERAKLIDPQHASPRVEPAKLAGITDKKGSDTIYLTVADKDGNIVSLIQSNYMASAPASSRKTAASCCKIAARFHAPARPAQYARAAQAPAPHDHPRDDGKGRRAHRFRHHGRLESGAGHAQFVSDMRLGSSFAAGARGFADSIAGATSSPSRPPMQRSPRVGTRPPYRSGARGPTVRSRRAHARG